MALNNQTEREIFTKIALPHTLQNEGGYSNHPNDSGGATMRGVTQKVYDGYRKQKGKLPQGVRYILTEELEDIYYKQYWLAAACDKVPYPLNVALFDFSVNAGHSRAIMCLQEALVMLGYTVAIDGGIGAKTLAAINAALAKYGTAKLLAAFISKIKAFRGRIMIRNPKLTAFKQGWANRDNGLEAYIKTLIA